VVFAPGLHWQPRFEETRSAHGRTDADGSATCCGILSQWAGGAGQPWLLPVNGTDSSSIAGMLSKVGGGGALIRSDLTRPVMTRWNTRVSPRACFATDHHEYYVTADDVVAGIQRASAYFDQPFGNSSVVPTYFCAQMARDDGVSRMLAGDGGDGCSAAM
jgi:asparagine synthase (glutamine-hydrolysing)